MGGDGHQEALHLPGHLCAADGVIACPVLLAEPTIYLWLFEINVKQVLNYAVAG